MKVELKFVSASARRPLTKWERLQLVWRLVTGIRADRILWVHFCCDTFEEAIDVGDDE